MESCTLEIILHSAKGLFDVKFFGTMDPYATLWIAGGGEESETRRTEVAKKAGPCPVWEYGTEFRVNDPMKNNYILFCEIQHDGKLFDRMIGEVQIPFKVLLAGDGSREKVSYRVKIQSGEVHGEIILSHKFSKPVVSRTTSGKVSSMGSASKKDGNTGTKGGKVSGNPRSGKKDGSSGTSSNKMSGNPRSGEKDGSGKVRRETKKVGRKKKKDGLVKKIVKDVGVEMASEAVLLAGTVGALYAAEHMFNGNEDEEEDDEYEDEDQDEDEYEYEDEDENEDEEDNGYDDEDQDEDEDEDEEEEEDEYEDEDDDEEDY